MPKLPRIVRVIDTTTGVCLAERAPVATSLWARAKGLLGRSELPAGEGLVLWPCTSVHCLGMRFPIDVLHVSKSGSTAYFGQHAPVPHRSHRVALPFRR